MVASEWDVPIHFQIEMQNLINRISSSIKNLLYCDRAQKKKFYKWPRAAKNMIDKIGRLIRQPMLQAYDEKYSITYINFGNHDYR